MDNKVCSKCKIEKPIREFSKSSKNKDKLRGWCKDCHNKYSAEYQKIRPIDTVLRKRKEYYLRLREKVFDLLGHKCVKCGFSDKRALQVDHIHGGGSRRRSLRKSGKIVRNLYLEVLSEPNAKEIYQVLCANCNTIKKIENGE